MIKRSPSLTDQVKTHIKQQILINTYEDDRIPSETDLAAELGVSRTTIRDALSRLENEGVVYRKQGSGTYVNRPGLQIRSRLDEIWSYSAVLEAHGYRPSAKVLDVKREAADPGLATSLELSTGDELVVVRKLFLEDKKPVIFTRDYPIAQSVPEQLLPNFSGYLKTDAATLPVTTGFLNDPAIIGVGCWALVRRKLMDAKKGLPRKRTEQGATGCPDLALWQAVPLSRRNQKPNHIRKRQRAASRRCAHAHPLQGVALQTISTAADAAGQSSIAMIILDTVRGLTWEFLMGRQLGTRCQH